MRGGSLGQFGLYGRIAMIVAVAIVLAVQLSRFRPPLGEKYLYLMEPGGYDFSFPYAGAQALLRGESPYTRENQYYPPTYYVLCLPLAFVFGDNELAAAQAMFYLNLFFFAVLAGLASHLLAEVNSRNGERFPNYLFFLVTFSLSFSGYFCLERGQADAFLSICCWGAVLAALKKRPGLAVGLAMVPALAKGYTVILVLGLAVLFLNRRQWWRVVLGGLLPVVFLLLPVVRYLPIAWQRTQEHLTLIDFDWSNTGFANLAHSLVGFEWHPLRASLAFLALVMTLVTFFVAHRKFHDPQSTSSQRAFWLVPFAACAVGTVTGYSSLSYCFNLLFFLPGMLIWATSQGSLVSELGLSKGQEVALGVIWTVVVAAVFSYCLPGLEHFPLASVGILLSLGLFGCSALRSLELESRAAAPGPKPVYVIDGSGLALRRSE